MFSTRAVPYEKLNPVGSVGGTVNLSWLRSVADASATLALDVTAPAQASANQLPVTATVQARFNPRGQTMDFSSLVLATPHTHLNAVGTLGSTSAALRLVLNTTSLTEFQPLLVAMGNPPPPVELAGAASFNGTLSGRLNNPRIAGHVQASDFTYLYSPTVKSAAVTAPAAPAKKRSLFHFASAQPPSPAPAPTIQPRPIHVDKFSGDVQYSSTEVGVNHGIIQEGTARLNWMVRQRWRKGVSPRTFHFRCEPPCVMRTSWNCSTPRELNYPVTGTLNFTVQAAGTEANPRASGHLSLTAARAYGRPVKSLTANLAFANHEAEAR